MKLTYSNCDQLKLVKGRLIHRDTKREWVEEEIPCQSCGDAFMRRADKPHNNHCEKNCNYFGKSNSLSKIHEQIIKSTEETPIPYIQSIPKQSVRAQKISAFLPVIKSAVAASKRNGNKKIANQVEREIKAEWKKTRISAQSVLSESATKELQELIKIEHSQKQTNELKPFLYGTQCKRKSMSQETKDKIARSNFGKKRTFETRQKLQGIRKGKKLAVMIPDEMLPIQIDDLKRNGQDIGVIASVAIKKEHSKLISLGKRIINKSVNLLRWIERK